VYAARLTEWLVSDQRKPRKERPTAKLMHADLVRLGYDGSYWRVAAFVREWKGERQRAQRTTDRGAFVLLAFGPYLKPTPTQAANTALSSLT
jgi:hypothetical protein